MTTAQIYCTLEELINDLSLNGDEPGLYSRIQTASQFIRRRFGNFIPITETRLFQGAGRDLVVDPLLAVSQILNDGTAIVDYQLHPLNRLWENGPYVRVYAESTNWVTLTPKLSSPVHLPQAPVIWMSSSPSWLAIPPWQLATARY